MSKKSETSLFKRILNWLNPGDSRLIDKIDPNLPTKKKVIAEIRDQLAKHHPEQLFLDRFTEKNLRTLSLEHLEKIREGLDMLV